MPTKLRSNTLIVAVLAIILAVLALVVFITRTPSAKAEIDSFKCTTSTVTAVSVGNQVSSRVIATSSSRAFLRIQQVRDAAGVATTTVALSLDEDAAATFNNGITLSTSTPYIDLGTNTTLPYTGAVQAITNTSSTTLRVTECVY
jgi:hypothetical protein